MEAAGFCGGVHSPQRLIGSPLINPCIRGPTSLSVDFADRPGLVLVLPFYLSSHGPTRARLAPGAALLVGSFLNQTGLNQA
jgi:hypothetical protein